MVACFDQVSLFSSAKRSEPSTSSDKVIEVGGSWVMLAHAVVGATGTSRVVEKYR